MSKKENINMVGRKSKKIQIKFVVCVPKESTSNIRRSRNPTHRLFVLRKFRLAGERLYFQVMKETKMILLLERAMETAVNARLNIYELNTTNGSCVKVVIAYH